MKKIQENSDEIDSDTHITDDGIEKVDKNRRQALSKFAYTAPTLTALAMVGDVSAEGSIGPPPPPPPLD